MTVSNLLKTSLATLVVTSSLITAAHATSVKCPSAEKVKGADKALNTVMRQGKSTYFVLSAQPAIHASDLSWMIVAQATGTGFDAAYENASNDVKAVMTAAMDSAMEQQGVYICAYLTSTGGMNVMAVAPQQQGLTFNPGVLNLDNIKASI